MDDGALAAVAGELPGGDQRRDRGRGHPGAPLVDDEAAVRVAVEGEAEVGTLGEDTGLQVDDVLRVEGVRLVVREGAVQLEVQGDEVERETGEDGGDGVAAHAVARVHDDLEGTDTREFDEAQQVRGVVGERLAFGDRAGCGGGRGRGAVLRPLLDQGADLRQAGVLADGCRSGAAHLDAVVPGRVVRGREHRTGQVQCPRGVVQLVRRAEPDQRDVGAPCRGTAGEGPGQAGRRGPHVVAHNDRVRVGDLDEGCAEQLGHRLVPLVGHDSTHVVRLDELRQVSNHGRSSWDVCGPPKLPGAHGSPTGGASAGHRAAPRPRTGHSSAGARRRALLRGAQHPEMASACDLHRVRRARPPGRGPRVPGRAAGPLRARRWRALRGRHRWGARGPRGRRAARLPSRAAR